MRRTPGCHLRAQGVCSRPQQEIDLWIGQYSLRRSLTGISSWKNRRNQSLVCGNRDEGLLDGLLQCLSEGDYDEPDGSNSETAAGTTAHTRRNGAAERGVGGPGRSWRSGRKG